MAKHYPTDQPPITSLTNISDDLDDDDDSDCDSLDSFFNEEFDDREKSEKLQDLLSCNTYGVESKVSLYIELFYFFSRGIHVQWSFINVNSGKQCYRFYKQCPRFQ